MSEPSASPQENKMGVMPINRLLLNDDFYVGTSTL